MKQKIDVLIKSRMTQTVYDFLGDPIGMYTNTSPEDVLLTVEILTTRRKAALLRPKHRTAVLPWEGMKAYQEQVKRSEKNVTVHYTHVPKRKKTPGGKTL